MKQVLIIVSIAVWAGALPTAASFAAENKVTVTQNDCRNVTTHTPSADVGYQAGVDVFGRPVAPADLNGPSPIKIPDEITIDIGIDLAEKYGLGAGGKYTGEANIGKVTVKGQDVYWNGQLLGNSEQHAIMEACKKFYGK